MAASDFSVSGESRTILRMRTTTDDKDLYPIYEYLRAGMTNKLGDGSAVSLHVGAWGRLDLADKSTDKFHDKDLQYGFISYRGAKSNTVVNLGRQFVSEGVAAEKIDGLYLRQDLHFDQVEGVAAAVFVGSPVLTETSFTGANLIYGGRISYSMPKYVTIGLSALKNEASDSSQYREEEGFDLWFHPMPQIDLTGRSSFNSITGNVMENAYVLTLSPVDKLKLSANLTSINYQDYFWNVTTKALSLTNGILDPKEKMVSAGIGASYAMKAGTVSADYKNYSYDIAGNADYFGVKAALSLPGEIAAGGGFHRMEGDNARLRYNELRLYALKKMGHFDVNADLFYVRYDKPVNDIRDCFAVTGSAGYEINEQMKLSADVEYSRSPDFYREVRGLVKFVYAFDTKATEGRGKSEK